MSISTTILRKADKFLQKQFKQELKNQGHYLTGGLEASMQGIVVESGRAAALQGTAANYGVFLDKGVAPSRIPYGGGSRGGGGGTSKYIQGLVTFWKLRGLSDKEALGAAFATAKKQKKEGMPTMGSYGYSKNGARTKFIQNTKAKALPVLNQLVLSEVNAAFLKEVSKTKSERI